MDFKNLASKIIDDVSGIKSTEISKNVEENDILEGLDLDFSETVSKDLSEDFDLEIEDETEEKVEQLFDGYLGEKNFVPNPLEYGPNAMYRQNGTVYRKSVDNLWEAYLKDGSPGPRGAAGGSGVGVQEVKSILQSEIQNINIPSTNSFNFQGALDNWMENLWIISAQTSANPLVTVGNYLNTSGGLSPFPSTNISAPINVKGKNVFWFMNTRATNVVDKGAYYNENGNWIGTISAIYSGQRVIYTIPSACSTIRLNYYNDASIKYYLGVLRDTENTKPFTKISFEGDSLFEGSTNYYEYNVPILVCSALKCEVNNNADGGRRVSGPTGMWNTLSAGTHHDSSCLVLMGGVNDYLNNVTIGNISSTNTSEFMGALNSACSYMKFFRPWQKFYLVTPPAQAQTSANTSGYTLRTYSEAMISAGYQWGVVVLDANKDLGIDISKGFDRWFYSADSLHYNWIGNRMIASYISKKLLSS